MERDAIGRGVMGRRGLIKEVDEREMRVAEA
jgi:hypothetical protein